MIPPLSGLSLLEDAVRRAVENGILSGSSSRRAIENGILGGGSSRRAVENGILGGGSSRRAIENGILGGGRSRLSRMPNVHPPTAGENCNVRFLIKTH